MVYSTYQFMLLFLPIVLLIYFSLSKTKSPIYQKIFLVLASLFFYGYYNVYYLFIIISSILVNYILAYIIQKTQKKVSLVLGILFNIALLGYFKYYDFFISNINAVFGSSFVLKNIILPLGISFFTFQQLSFLISVYKKEERVENFLDYSLFVTFFPQLVAGPIVLYSEMLPQFKDENRRAFNIDNFTQGLYRFSIGAFKKTVIADTVAVFVDNGFEMQSLSFLPALIVSLSYTFQIYFDFSGYSDMAIGLGKMFNINIPENFDYPYKSKSITEFWRRWHMTLGRALSTYIYKPLGGNRTTLLRTGINLFVTFLVSGIWHGASWTFILWGALHGAFAVFERVFKDKLSKIPDFIRTTFTFLIVNALWVLFRAKSFREAKNVYKGMVNFKKLGFTDLAEISKDIVNLPSILSSSRVLLIVLVLLFVVFKMKDSKEMAQDFTLSKKSAVLVAVLIMLSVICISRGSVFIYFNF